MSKIRRQKSNDLDRVHTLIKVQQPFDMHPLVVDTLKDYAGVGQAKATHAEDSLSAVALYRR